MSNNVVPLTKKIRRFVGDSLQNLVNGLGTSKDATTYGRYVVNNLTRDQLDNAYRGDWIARKTVNLPADDSTREWRDWQATGDQIEAIETLETAFNLQNKLRQGMIKARLYGGAGIVMGVNSGMSHEELVIDRVGKDMLQFLHVLGKEELKAAELITDITSPWFGEPQYYETTGAARVRFHPSRVVRLIGAELPDVKASPTDGRWGDSVLQVVDDAIKDAGLVSGGIASLVNDSKLDVINIPNLAESLSTQEYTDNLTARLTYANTMKSMVNALVLDGDEKWERITTNFGGLPDVLKLYLLIASAAADIPVTRMMGQSPAGMNATGESDTRNYYDRIASDQRTVLSPALARLDEVLIRSALGTRDPSIWYMWTPLWQMSEKEKAEIAKSKGDAFKNDIDSQALPIEVLRKGRQNQLIEDGTYPGLEDAIKEHETASLANSDLGEVVTPLGTDNVQNQAFNGAQITAISGIITSVVTEQLPPATAIKLVTLGFPTISEEDAKAMIDPIATFTPKSATPPPSPINPPAPTPPALRVVGKDAEPRTMYVRRDVLNAKEILSWAKVQGFDTTVGADELHVTVMYSKKAIDWLKVDMDVWGQDDKGQLLIPPGGPRVIEEFGDNAIVLAFANTRLQWRHEDLKRSGASYDYDDYTPHITITYNMPEDFDLSKVEPYQGKILLGPEIFEEIKANAQAGIEEVST